MSVSQASMRGKYFEDFELGQRVISPARTVTEADITAFAGLSGDYNAIHTDAEFAKGTPFGERIAHGLLGLSIASGLADRTGFIEGTVLAFREISSWKFVQPILIGSTIHVEIEVEQIKAIPRLGGGLLTLLLNVINEKDEIVMKGRWSVLIKGRP